MRNTWLLFLILLFKICNGKNTPKKRVCVIGAGRAGLAAIKVVADQIQNFDLVAFERNSDIGGLWIYRDSLYLDEHGLLAHSGIYKHLTTNIRKRFMVYPDYSELNSKADFVSHEVFLDYMKNYTDHFQFRKYIQFDTLVTKVIPMKIKNNWKATTWRIELINLKTKKNNSTNCDAVIVCNGHYSKPNIPVIHGMETFVGQKIHSRAYRIPDGYKGSTIFILGAGESGTDIAYDLSNYAKKVYLSHRHDNDPYFGKQRPKNVEVVRGVASVKDHEIYLQDNSTIAADVFIFCTGYLIDFPFLDQRSGIIVEKKNVHPLYRDSINVENPSMIFVGLPWSLVYGSLYYDQVEWFLKLLQGENTLPNYEKMLELDSENLMKEYK